MAASLHSGTKGDMIVPRLGLEGIRGARADFMVFLFREPVMERELVDNGMRSR